MRAGFKLDVYWKTLHAHGLTKEKLASYDRPIVSEPCFRMEAKEGLIRDLTMYLKTLKVSILFWQSNILVKISLFWVYISLITLDLIKFTEFWVSSKRSNKLPCSRNVFWIYPSLITIYLYDLSNKIDHTVSFKSIITAVFLL